MVALNLHPAADSRGTLVIGVVEWQDGLWNGGEDPPLGMWALSPSHLEPSG